ncbi:MAG: membrane lipoprotein lipid attachment site-containing protein [Solobacterium sp.]|nr:membrane lipoprotein lipid attachment site-containing protein [Solobacterium sp.]
MKRIFFFILFVFMLVGCRSNNHQYHEVSTYEKAMQDSGIDFEAPEELASSILKDIRVYDEGMIEIIYLDLNHHETAVFQ